MLLLELTSLIICLFFFFETSLYLSIPPPVVTITGLPSGGSTSDQDPIRLRSELLPMEEQGGDIKKYTWEIVVNDVFFLRPVPGPLPDEGHTLRPENHGGR